MLETCLAMYGDNTNARKVEESETIVVTEYNTPTKKKGWRRVSMHDIKKLEWQVMKLDKMSVKEIESLNA